MNASLSAIVHRMIEVAWRRRLLIILPILCILPLGLIFAKFGPRTYVAKSLVLLQETGRDNPLQQELPTVMRMQERIAGLQALLKSDRILYAVMHDILGSETPTDQRIAAAWVRDFSSALSLELVGNDFLEFRLKGLEPKGMGKQLEIVISRFLEALLPAQDVPRATKVIFDRLKDDVQQTEDAYAQAKADARRNLPPEHAFDFTQLAAQRAQLKQKSAELEELDAQIAELSENSTASHATRELTGTSAAPVRAAAEAELPSEVIAEIQAAERRRALLRAQIDQLGKNVVAAERAKEQMAASERKLQLLEEDMRKARTEYDDYARRYVAPAGSQALNLLNAPERMKLIDAPSDPQFPQTPAWKLSLIFAVLSTALAIGLAFVAEIMDSKVRHPDQFGKITGVPVIVRLPC